MPRYFFNLYNDVTSMDDEGEEFPDLVAARAHGVSAARVMAAESVRNGKINMRHHIDVVDKSGNILERVRFGDAVSIEE
jgi:hypothetical protein